MSHENKTDVIFVNDSEHDHWVESNSPTSDSSLVLLHSTLGILVDDNSDIEMIDGPAAKSLATRPRDIIDVDSESDHDRPPPKRARKESLTARSTASDFEDDQHISKIIHGSAVEPDHLTPWKIRKDVIWVTAAQIHQKYKKSMLHTRKQRQLTVKPFVIHKFAPISARFHLAGGAINRIVQQSGCIAVSSATLGGQPDTPGSAAQPTDAYNRAGTLQIWRDGKGVILHGHCIFEESQNQSEPTCCKCYTVNSVNFDPNRDHLMASAGNNCTVQLWQDHKRLNNGYYKYPRAPHDVVYREKDSLLAVTCMNGSVYVHQTQWPEKGLLGDPIELRVVPPNVRHSVGAIAWGQGASEDTLFASSESQGTDDYSGFHLAFDPDQGRRIYKFSASESGDGMALDPDGARLAICTAAHDGVHFVRIYDVHRKNGQRAVQEVRLDSFYPNLRPTAREGEVTAVSFSPDGLLLAVARSDDEVHVYDTRFMGQGREPLRRFLHWGDNCCMAGDEWGVVDAVWVDGWCGRGLGIVTGGSDGCVRFWDVRRSADDIQNGDVLAQPNSDIGHFSVGDPRNGEKPLVVGDNGGRVYVYDNATACSSTKTIYSMASSRNRTYASGHNYRG